MKVLFTKITLFIVFLIILIIGNMYIFRSDYPQLSFITIIGSLIGLIFIPYNKLFKINN